VLVIRLEGDTPEALKRIEQVFGAALKKLDPSIKLPFSAE
jgi:hypothetical protein